MSSIRGGSSTNSKNTEWSGFFRQAGESFAHADSYFRKVLDGLPAPIYITDAAGLITYYNEAAATLWGHRPELGISQWSGFWKLCNPDGSPLPHDACPAPVTRPGGELVEGAELIAERPDGARVPFVLHSTPLHASGALVGAVNMLADISDRKRADEYAQRLVSIIESSDDAIISKDLNGVITSWNRGAQRLFGYASDEVIGKSITILIPDDRQEEEPAILSRLRRGERVEHFESVRRRKDGGLVDISLTISPVREASGKIIGASKIARDITESRRAREQQRLLLNEMDHRVKNLFALASSVVTLSARSAKTPEDMALAVGDRLAALARAHALTLPQVSDPRRDVARSTSLQALLRTIVSPYQDNVDSGRARFVISGPDVEINGGAVTSLALLLHEFSTNAAKYGALSTPQGYIDVVCSEEQDRFAITWSEHGGPRVERTDSEGFGTVLGRITVKRQLQGEITRDWRPEGLVIRLTVSRTQLTGA